MNAGLKLAIERFAAFEFNALFGNYSLDEFSRQSELHDDAFIDDMGAARGDGTKRQLFLTGNAKFSYNAHIKRQTQLTGNFKPNRNPASWQRDHHRVSVSAKSR